MSLAVVASDCTLSVRAVKLRLNGRNGGGFSLYEIQVWGRIHKVKKNEGRCLETSLTGCAYFPPILECISPVHSPCQYDVF